MILREDSFYRRLSRRWRIGGPRDAVAGERLRYFELHKSSAPTAAISSRWGPRWALPRRSARREDGWDSRDAARSRRLSARR